MNDRRIAALRVMLERRRRLDDTLRETLSAQRAAHAALLEQEQSAQAAVHAEAAQLADYDRRLTQMLSSRAPLDIPLFTQCGEYRGVVAERHATAQAELSKARKATKNKEADMTETRRQILRNEGQIEVVERRLAELRRVAAQAIEDAQDEEIEESMAARALRRRRVEDAKAAAEAMSKSRHG
jgi:type III secretion system HrpB7-like protein